MFDRPAFKAAGKANFQRNYWACVAVSVILAIALGFGTGATGAASGFSRGLHCGSGGANSFGSGYGYSSFDWNDEYNYSGIGGYGDYGAAVLAPIIAIFAGIAAIAGTVGFAVKICAVNPYHVGACRFFMENRERADAKFSLVGKGFSKNYSNVVLTQFLRDLYILLWTLLFIVPGIIKSYAYFCVPYILSENADLDHRRVLDLSRQMTRGCKGDIFITDLSFILWFLLDALTLGVLGVFFVNPYVFGTRAEIYAQLRQTALENGLATTVELPGFGDTGPRRMSGESWYN